MPNECNCTPLSALLCAHCMSMLVQVGCHASYRRTLVFWIEVSHAWVARFTQTSKLRRHGLLENRKPLVSLVVGEIGKLLNTLCRGFEVLQDATCLAAFPVPTRGFFNVRIDTGLVSEAELAQFPVASAPQFGEWMGALPSPVFHVARHLYDLQPLRNDDLVGCLERVSTPRRKLNEFDAGIAIEAVCLVSPRQMQISRTTVVVVPLGKHSQRQPAKCREKGRGGVGDRVPA
mmetsp:Transcript_63158/g.149661  ORF Transcript_63158/g.149661 Transcript_63158/m.149661 type:complete len:232 (-) Transcript_63158:772-1467(-)